MSKRIIHDHNKDGIDRGGFLQCMAWAGTGVIWTVSSRRPELAGFRAEDEGREGRTPFRPDQRWSHGLQLSSGWKGNGHIHQVMQKTEGNVMFHTAMSTAFPQAAPGPANHPGPMKVADDKLRGVLGITNVQSVMKKHSLAVVDSTLAPADAASSSGGTE